MDSRALLTVSIIMLGIVMWSIYAWMKRRAAEIAKDERSKS